MRAMQSGYSGSDVTGVHISCLRQYLHVRTLHRIQTQDWNDVSQLVESFCKKVTCNAAWYTHGCICLIASVE